MEITLTKENFDEVVLKSTKPVIVDFWASWCGPCRMLAPVIEEIAEERDDIVVCKLNVDEQPEISDKFRISTIPTVMLFVEGKPTATSVGYRKKDALLSALKL